MTRSNLFGLIKGTANLRQKSIRGATVTGFGQIVKFVLQFGSTAILARLLTPADYGLIAMVSLVTIFVEILKEGGLTAATIQKDDITHEQISTLFWFNAALGCCMAICLLGISPLVAMFFDEAKLVKITCVLSIGFIFGGISVQHQALLRRNMQFSILMLLDICSRFFSIVVAIIMAWNNFGYWSLVGMTLVRSVVDCLGVWIFVRWIPGLPKRGYGVKSMLKFGFDVLSFKLLNFFSRQFDNILIGKYCSVIDLGLYNKAYNMLLLPIQQVNSPLSSVALPALSRVKNDPKKFSRYFLHVLQLVSSICLPIVALMTIFSYEVISLLLGNQWLECAYLFKLLGVSAALGVISNPLGWLLVALGDTKKYRNMGIFTSVAIVAGFLIGIPYGVRGVATAYSVTMCLITIPTWLFVLKSTSIRSSAVLHTIFPAIVACIFATILSLIIKRLTIFGAESLLNSFFAVCGFTIVYLSVLLYGFNKVGFYLSIFNDLRSR